MSQHYIVKQEAALRAYYATFPWRTLAVRYFVDELIAEWCANPPAPPRHSRINNGEDYEHPETGEALLDGMTHPGL